jgi:VCBS repeat-containing protein
VAPGLLGNDSDIEGDALTINTVPISVPTNGTATLNADGSYEYMHNGSETVSDSFVYEMSDGNEGTDTAVVNITVTPQNDAPVAVNDTEAVLEGGTLTVTSPGVLGNDSDDEGDALTVNTTPVSGPTNGTVILNADGAYEYIHDGSETISDSFVYEVSDINSAKTTAVVNITVTPQNDAPEAVDDMGTVLEGSTLNVAAPGLLGNDSDIEGDPLTINTTQISGPANGSLTLNADGSYEYIHNGSDTSIDSFIYQVSDGNGSTDNATVNISVQRQKIAPISDNFNDNIDNGWSHSTGTWLVENGEYSGSGSGGEIAVSIMDASATSDAVIIETDYLGQQSGINLNGFIIFDYQGLTDFKYAGARGDSDYWTIGYYDGSWNDVAIFSETIGPLQWYRMIVKITGTTVTLYVDDNRDGSGFVRKAEHTYSTMSFGKTGLAVEQSHALFDNFEIYDYILYYVSPSGSDSNNGKVNAPLRTIQRAADSVNSGDTVIVKDGTYTVSSGEIVVNMTSSGTSDQWITFKSENKWGAVINGNNNAINYCINFEDTAQYIRVEDFEITGCSKQGINSNQGADFIYVYGNHIHDNGKIYTGDTSGHNGTFINCDSRYWTFDSNVYHHNGRLHGGYPNELDHDHGLYIVGSNTTVVNNIFYTHDSGWAIQVAGAYGASCGNNITIFNNTFSDANPARNGHIVLWGDSFNVSIQNNIFYEPNDSAIRFNQEDNYDVIVRNNLVYPDIDIILDNSYTSTSHPGIVLSENIVNQDPGFKNAASRDYHLQSGSPAIDAGLPAVLKDIEGTSRPQGSGYDIGAYEYASGMP